MSSMTVLPKRRSELHGCSFGAHAVQYLRDHQTLLWPSLLQGGLCMLSPSCQMHTAVPTHFVVISRTLFRRPWDNHGPGAGCLAYKGSVSGESSS